jgi:threonine/homoserine/homoserine lactone efflux protein
VEGGRSLFGKGLLTGFSNPKAIIMFSAVFPQFAGAGEHNSMTDIAILGLTFLLLQFASGCLYGYFGQRIKPVLENPRRRVWLQRITALLLLGVAGMLARGFSH